MADYFTKKYVYPANWQGSTPESPGNKVVDLLLSFRSGGTTGLTAQEVLDPADWRLQGPAGRCPPCTRLGLAKVCWSINGKIDYVRFYWDRTPAEDAMVCASGNGEECFVGVGGLWDNSDGLGDGTGRLMMDIVGATDKGAASIRLSINLGE